MWKLPRGFGKKFLCVFKRFYFSLIANRKICPAMETDTLRTVASFLWSCSLAWVPPGRHRPAPRLRWDLELEVLGEPGRCQGRGNVDPSPGSQGAFQTSASLSARVVPVLLPGRLYTETPFPPGLEHPRPGALRVPLHRGLFLLKKSFDPRK